MSEHAYSKRFRVTFGNKLTPAGEVTWFVVDLTGRSGPRRLGTGPRALKEARWLSSLLNDLEADRDAAQA